MKREPKILIEDNTIFMSLDLKGLNLYQRGKAIRTFINSDTKIVEDYADNLIRSILRKYGITISDTSEDSYLNAMIKLRQKNKRIEVTDYYKDLDIERCEVVTTTKSKMTILLEDNRYLNVGVMICEEDYD